MDGNDLLTGIGRRGRRRGSASLWAILMAVAFLASPPAVSEGGTVGYMYQHSRRRWRFTTERWTSPRPRRSVPRRRRVAACSSNRWRGDVIGASALS